jgi:hypothetical protein
LRFYSELDADFVCSQGDAEKQITHYLAQRDPPRRSVSSRHADNRSRSRRYPIAASALTSPVEQHHIKVSGDIEGVFKVEEDLGKGRFVIAMAWPSKETSADAILDRAGAARMSSEEFDKHFGDLSIDGDGQ